MNIHRFPSRGEKLNDGKLAASHSPTVREVRHHSSKSEGISVRGTEGAWTIARVSSWVAICVPGRARDPVSVPLILCREGPRSNNRAMLYLFIGGRGAGDNRSDRIQIENGGMRKDASIREQKSTTGLALSARPVNHRRFASALCSAHSPRMERSFLSGACYLRLSLSWTIPRPLLRRVSALSWKLGWKARRTMDPTRGWRVQPIARRRNDVSFRERGTSHRREVSPSISSTLVCSLFMNPYRYAFSLATIVDHQGHPPLAGWAKLNQSQYRMHLERQWQADVIGPETRCRRRGKKRKGIKIALKCRE